MFSMSQLLRMDWEEIRAMLSGFVQHLRCKNVAVPDISFICCLQTSNSDSETKSQKPKSEDAVSR